MVISLFGPMIKSNGQVLDVRSDSHCREGVLGSVQLKSVDRCDLLARGVTAKPA